MGTSLQTHQSRKKYRSNLILEVRKLKVKAEPPNEFVRTHYHQVQNVSFWSVYVLATLARFAAPPSLSLSLIIKK
jgi:hypothetical protein